jgi:hypothetical protein
MYMQRKTVHVFFLYKRHVGSSVDDGGFGAFSGFSWTNKDGRDGFNKFELTKFK